MQKLKKIHISDVLIHMAILFLMFITLYPMWYVVMASISDPVLAAQAKGVLFLPKGIQWAGYQRVFENKEIWSGYLNTIFYTVVSTFLNVVLTAALAYPLARNKLKFKKPITLFVMFTMFFNGGMIPTYLVMNKLGFLDTRAAVIIPGLVSVFNFIIMRTNFESIPESLEESAYLDGANDWKIFWKIILPLSKSTMAMMVLGLTACGGGEATTGTTAEAGKTVEETTTTAGVVEAQYPLATEAKALTIYAKNSNSSLISNYNEIKAFDVASEKLGVTFEWEHPVTGSETDQYNLMIASQSLPDVIFWDFSTTSTKLQGLLDNGSAIDMDNLIRQYAPNYMAALEADEELMKHVDVLCCQDAGGKAYCIEHLKKQGYAPDHVLVIGDAPGDQTAAEKNGVYYYPILVQHEKECWEELECVGLERFRSCTYAEYGMEKKKDFIKNLGGK